MKAIIWRESIYNGDFKCSFCGAQLADEDGQPTDNVGFDADKTHRQDVLYCCKCRQPVAFIRDYHKDVPAFTLGGKWPGEI